MEDGLLLDVKNGMKNQNKIKKIKALVIDNDGVLTDNKEIIGFPDGYVLKSRSHYDGQGISFLRAIGIRVIIITGEKGIGARFIEQLVKKWNNLPSVKKKNGWAKIDLFTGLMGKEKADAFRIWSEQNSISLEDCVVMGDDYADLELFKIVGYRAVPVSAENDMKKIADFISLRPGGSGAVRDLVNHILLNKNIDPKTLSLK